MPIVSEVQVHLTKPHDGLIGYASMVIDGSLYLGNIGIHQRLDGSGYRLTYPTRKAGETSINIFHPINRETSIAIEQAVLKKLKDVLRKRDDRYHCADAGTTGF